jgi:hypothetical protein
MGRQILERWSQKDYGYEKNGYCRFALVDSLLFDDMNKNKKSAAFKRQAQEYMEKGVADWREIPGTEVVLLAVPKGYQPDVLDMDKFEDYCYMRKPSRFSKDFLMNDIYFYSAILYSVWTGKCYRRDFDAHTRKEMEAELEKQNLNGEQLLTILEQNLSEDAVYKKSCDISYILDALCAMSGKSE